MRRKGWNIGKRIGILIGLVIASMIGLSEFAAEGEAPRFDSAVGMPGVDTTLLARRILLLQREYRLRNRAMALLSEVSLFGDDATLGRSVRVWKVNQGFLEITASRVYVADLGYDTAGVGDRGAGSPALVTDIEALRLEIRALEEQRKKK